MALKFNPIWLQKTPEELSNDECGMFRKWLEINMGKMPKAERESAKRVRNEISRVLIARRIRKEKELDEYYASIPIDLGNIATVQSK